MWKRAYAKRSFVARAADVGNESWSTRERSEGTTDLFYGLGYSSCICFCRNWKLTIMKKIWKLLVLSMKSARASNRRVEMLLSISRLHSIAFDFLLVQSNFSWLSTSEWKVNWNWSVKITKKSWMTWLAKFSSWSKWGSYFWFDALNVYSTFLSNCWKSKWTPNDCAKRENVSGKTGMMKWRKCEIKPNERFN